MRIPMLCLLLAVARTRRAEAAPVAHGTPGYAAPERLAGAPPDAAADQYAAGVVLYEAASGRCFVAGADATALPASLDEICRTALARDPAARFAGCAALAAALDEAARRAGAGPAAPTRLLQSA